MDISECKQWAEMNVAERDQFLDLIEHVMSKVADERDEPDWRDIERMDAYREAVQSCLGRSDEDLDGEDLTDHFYKHCERGFMRGMARDAWARQWRCRGP